MFFYPINNINNDIIQGHKSVSYRQENMDYF